jgi:hypothetical protein
MTRRGSWLALAVGVALLPAAHRAASQEVEREDVEARQAWFWAQRTYPFGEISYAALARMQQIRVQMAQSFSSTLGMAPLVGAWRSIGPNGLWDAGGGFFGTSGGLDIGRIAAIAPAATPGGPMYIATATGGVWRSTNNGLSWTPLTDNECELDTGADAIDPVNPSLVYAGTGEANGGSLGCGVLRSANGGTSWTTSSTAGIGVQGGGVINFYTLVVDASTAGSASATVLLGGVNFNTPGGIARSTNGGATWSLVTSAQVGSVSSIVAHPTRAGVYYAGARLAPAAAGRGVYRSTDIGATWSQLPALPVQDPNAIGRVEVAVSRAQPNSVWALVGNRTNNRLLGLFRWDEGTNEWTQLAAAGVVSGNTSRGDFGAQSIYDLALAIDPRDAQRIFLAGVRAYRSSDGGASFQPMGMEIHSDWHVIVFDRFNPDIMWAGTDGGVFLSTDGGSSWVSRNAGLTITQYYPGIAIHPVTGRIIGGAQDNGTTFYSGSLFWDGFAATGDGGYNAINYANPSIQWYTSYWNCQGVGTGACISRRTAAGTSSRVNGIVAGDRAQFIPPLIMDPVTPTTLYFGTHRLYRTDNEGLLWTPLSGDLTGGSGTITTIAVAPSDPKTIYVGTSDGRVAVTRDGGATYTQATGLPNRFVTRVAVHPTDPTRALITLSGFGSPHVFETSDALATVRSIAGNLADAPANVALYVDDQNVVLVGTDVGVFQTSNGGTSWSLGPTGLPNVIVQDLVYQPAANLLVAATYGRGMFAYNVTPPAGVLRGDVTADGRVDAADALVIQQALVASSAVTTTVLPRGDANCNGTLDAADVVLVLRAAVGLPNGTACVGTVR